ncbi:MAG: hypothetical protein JHC93_08385 [Parachlamydiales bacterium]|nr:hypothetical protein [Parachlamydiales bacterium]
MFTASGLGDGLIYSIVARNLALNGYEVSIFNTPLIQLQTLYSYAKIFPHPKPDEWLSICSQFDMVVMQMGFPPSEKVKLPSHDPLYKHVKYFKNWEMDSSLPLADNLVQLCFRELNIQNPVKDIALDIPKGLIFKKYPKRVILHTMSADSQKIWPAKFFVQVAQGLLDMGYEPIIIVSPEERDEWCQIAANANLLIPSFNSLSTLAEFIYESGFVIGNDSGIAHLGSALGLKTITIHQRSNRAQFWKPGWTDGIAVTVNKAIPTRYLRLKFWKILIRPGQVINAFKKLTDF